MTELHRKKQWSIKLDNGEIYVMQEDTFEDLQLAREEVMSAIKRNIIDDVPIEDELKVTESKPVAPSLTPSKFVDHTIGDSHCDIHDVEMKLIKGKYGDFYSHGRKLPDDSWDNCSGSGYKSEKK